MQGRIMRLVLVSLMDDFHKSYSTAALSQPPLSIAVLHSLTPEELNPVLLDEQVDEIKLEGDVFAFSVTTQLARKTYRIADELRSQGKTVILGGYHVTVLPDEASKHADAIITGEAEIVWPRICDDIISGVLEPRYSGGPTPPEKMPLIDRTVFKGKNYNIPGALYASRGCVFNCAFCASSRIYGGYRKKPLEMLDKEIDEIRRVHGDVVLQFTDDNLLADRAHSEKLLALLREKKARFICQMTADQLCNKNLVDLAAASGCRGVAVGIESPDEDNQKSINKSQNLKQPIAQAVRYANRKGLHVVALLIVGLDHDTPDRVESAITRLRGMPFSAYDPAILRPLPGTPLYDAYLAQGRTIENWWLKEEPHLSNALLPGYLRVYFRHKNFSALALQKAAVDTIRRLNFASWRDMARILLIGARRRDIAFALRVMAGRVWLSKQAGHWMSLLNTEKHTSPRAKVVLPLQRTC